MPIALVLVLVAVGSVLFHMLSPWWWTPIASNWQYIDSTIIDHLLDYWICLSAVSFCSWLIASTAFVTSRAGGRPMSRKTRSWNGGWRSARQWVSLPCWRRVCLCGTSSSRAPATQPRLRWWASSGSGAFDYPGKDGQLGTSDTRNVTPENPLGLNPDDPNGQDDIVIIGDDLHLPVGKPVKVLLRAIDVVHDFYVPEFRAKMDMIPGSVTYYWFTPTRQARFEVLCAELCGVGHPYMRGRVVVDEAASIPPGWSNSEHSRSRTHRRR